MVRDLFKEYASGENNPDWEYHIERRTPLYTRKNDIRSEYAIADIIFFNKLQFS